MLLTSHPSVSPAQGVLARYGSLLAQLGAPTVSVTSPTTLTVAYRSGVRAANAAALLKDAVDGAQLVVQGPPGGAPRAASTAGIVALLRGVPGVTVERAGSTEPGRTGLWVTSPDAGRTNALAALVEQFPTPDTNVMLFVP